MQKQRHAATAGLVLLMAAGFAAWSARFIDLSSLVAVNGQRYFSLFDDAMISMRYAWNLAHGHGPVWNPGEHVEGYTNLLMVLIMAVPNALLAQRWAVLSIQIFGIGTMLGGAALTGAITVALASPSAGEGGRSVRRVLGFGAALLYYPLAYWSLMGMETGLLALLLLAGVWVLLCFDASGDVRWVRGLALLIGLAYLTRPEALMLGGLLMLVAADSARRKGLLSDRREIVRVIALAAVLPLALHLFRWAYYGELFANTYTLKAKGLPLGERIEYGWDYTAPFLREHALLLVAAVAGIALRGSRLRALLGTMVASMIVYQIFVGGDVPAWTYWRMVAPVMPLALALAINAPFDLADRIGGSRSAAGIAAAGLIVVGIALGTALDRFRDELLLRVPPYQASLNGININTALLIDASTTPDASLGVFWAGTIPYYNPERTTIDYLGKSDPYIANLTPDPDDPMSSWPGHNKHDLAYSIQQLQPTYTEQFAIGGSSVSAWGRLHYAALVYDPDTTLFFKLDDPAVDYARAFAAGLFPWMQWNIDPFFEDPASLPPDAVILMPANTLALSVPARTPDQFTGAAADALAAWQGTRQPDDLRAAGIDYLLVDHGWWETLSEDERATLSDPALYTLVKEWRVYYVFVRLYEVNVPPG